jgi:hypothetical protein
MSRGALEEKTPATIIQAMQKLSQKPKPSRDTVSCTIFSQEPTSLLPDPGAPRGFLLPPVREDLFGLYPVGFPL